MIVGGMVLAGQVEQHLYRHTGRMHNYRDEVQ